MFCSKCGSQVQDGAVFCPKCGAPMSADAAGNAGYQPATGYSGGPVATKTSMNVVRVIASVVVILATFMPFVSALGYNKSLIDGGDGYIFMGLAAVVIVCDLIRKAAPAMVISILTLGFAIYEIVDTQKIASQAFGLIQNGIGFYLLILGSIAMVIAGPVMKAVSKKN